MKQEAMSLTLREEPFELRNAYILEMTPRAAGFGNLRGLVFVDTEAYVWLAAEFFDTSERTAVAVPLWRSHPSPAGGNLFDLAGEFYIPTRPPMSDKSEHTAAHTRDSITSPNFPAGSSVRCDPHMRILIRKSTAETWEKGFSILSPSHDDSRSVQPVRLASSLSCLQWI
jgi:hypothetical protein